MPIKGLSDARRFTRLGKIRLGEKKKAQSGNLYPSKIDYFKIDPYDDAIRARCEELCGQQPRKLTVAIPDEDTEKVFPQYYECWSASALLCKGDGDNARRNTDGNLVECECPGPELCPFALQHGTTFKGEQKTGCKRVARLSVVLPDLDSFGVFQLDTGSANSIININSALDFVRSVAGRIAWIPLEMVIKAQKATNPADKKQITIYVVDILLPVGLRDITTLKPLLTYTKQAGVALLEGPDSTRPEDLLPALPAPVVNEETGEVLDDEGDWPEETSLADDPDVAAALENLLPARRQAALDSAAAQGWDKDTFLKKLSIAARQAAPATVPVTLEEPEPTPPPPSAAGDLF